MSTPRTGHRRWVRVVVLGSSTVLVAVLAALAWVEASSTALALGLAAMVVVVGALLVWWQAALLAENGRLVDRLEREANRFRLLVDTAPIAIVETDLAGRVQLWNHEAEHLLGQPEQAVLGTRVLLTNDDDPEAGGPVRRLLAGEIVRNEEMWLSSPDAGPLDLLVSGAPVHDAEGRAVSVLCLASDNAPGRRMQAALADAEKMRALGQLAGGLAHDFNNLLAVILWTAEAMHSEDGRNAGDQDDLQEIITAGRRAAALIDQLVSFSQRRLEQVGEVDASRVVHGLLPVLDRLVGGQIGLRADLDTEPGPVALDAASLEQVVTNLVENAANATAAQGSVEIRTRNVDIESPLVWTTGTVPPGHYLEIEVADEGEGIDPLARPRIFEPFFSSGTNPTRRGMGLPAVRGIVVQAGGHLDVQSVPFQGTRIRLVLPRAAEPTSAEVPSEAETSEAETSEAETSEAETSEAAVTILLVDDEDAVRRAAHRILVGPQRHIIPAASAEEALDLVEGADRTIDLLVTDLMMPGLSGLELGRRFRQTHPDARIILMSGFAADALGQPGEFDRLDADFEILPKPFTRQTLLAAVTRHPDAPAEGDAGARVDHARDDDQDGEEREERADPVGRSDQEAIDAP